MTNRFYHYHRPEGFIAPEDEDTIELQLSAEQMQVLLRAAVAEKLRLVANPVVANPVVASPVPLKSAPELIPSLVPPLADIKAGAGHGRSKARLRGALRAAAPSMVGALALLVAFAFVAGNQVSGVTPAVTPVIASGTSRPLVPELLPPAATATESIPVRFTNPFDAAEVFEFPPGTNEIDAHDAVAEFLINRARERQMTNVGASVTEAPRHDTVARR